LVPEIVSKNTGKRICSIFGIPFFFLFDKKCIIWGKKKGNVESKNLTVGKSNRRGLEFLKFY